MTSEHLISLLKVNYNNIDDLKKIQTSIECMIEAIELEDFLKKEEKQKTEEQPKTLQQSMQHAKMADANGTSLKGYVATTYNNLIKAFGLPTFEIPPSKMDKVTIEWILRFADGTIATIYDWKGYGYKPSPDEIYEWHVGGHHASVVALVKDELGLIYGTGPCRD